MIITFVGDKQKAMGTAGNFGVEGGKDVDNVAAVSSRSTVRAHPESAGGKSYSLKHTANALKEVTYP